MKTDCAHECECFVALYPGRCRSLLLPVFSFWPGLPYWMISRCCCLRAAIEIPQTDPCKAKPHLWHLSSVTSASTPGCCSPRLIPTAPPGSHSSQLAGPAHWSACSFPSAPVSLQIEQGCGFWHTPILTMFCCPFCLNVLPPTKREESRLDHLCELVFRFSQLEWSLAPRQSHSPLSVPPEALTAFSLIIRNRVYAHIRSNIRTSCLHMHLV